MTGQKDDFTEFLAALIAGDASADDRFITRFWPHMARKTRRRLGDSKLTDCEVDDVCDTVLERFLRLLRAGKVRGKEPAQVAAMLTGMINHEIDSRERSASRAKRDAGRLDDSPIEDIDLYAHGPDPSWAAEAKELWDMCAEELSGEERWLFFERHCGGSTFRQIAAIQEESEDAARMRHARARDMLRAKFGHLFDAP